MTPLDVIVLNGGSSSGTTTVARALQDVLLPRPWLVLGVDDLVAALPSAWRGPQAEGIVFAEGGAVSVGEGFRALEAAWMAGVAATARAGAPVLVDDVFLGGAASQRRWEHALDGLAVLWAGIHCAPGTAAAREALRPERVPGMARSQAHLVHEGVRYDVEVDTSGGGPQECARRIAALVPGCPGDAAANGS